MTALLIWLLPLVTPALSVLGLAPLDAAPRGGNGFAGSIVVAFVAIGLLAILAKWTSSKPRKPKK